MLTKIIYFLYQFGLHLINGLIVLLLPYSDQSHIIRKALMFANWSYQSSKPDDNVTTLPKSIYFPFGDEREKLKSYVFDQLHGKDAIKNAEILTKFREDAERRKHRRLHGISYTHPPQMMKRSLNPEQFLPSLSHETNHIRYSNYMPNQYRRHSLIPTNKTPPPIYKFTSLDTYEGLKTKRSERKDSLRAQTSVNLQQTIKHKKYLERHADHHKKKSESIDIKPSYKDNALTKIKQIAQQKRKGGNRKNKEQTYSTDSSQILEELECKVQHSSIQYRHLQKQLKKFKKYRNYLKKVEGYNF